MAGKVLLKKSSVTAKVPLVTDLDYGELAINYADEKLYFKNADNEIRAFSVSGSASGNIFTVSNTAPSDPSTGDTWFYTTTGIKYTYIDDGDSSQWVALETPGSSSFTSSGGTSLPTDSLSPFLLMGA
jgi:hypothetical protein